MAISTGNRGITEYGIDVLVESEDGRLKASSRGQGIAQINMTVDRAAVGVLNSIRMNPLVICFDAQVPENLPGTKKCIEMAQPLYMVGSSIQKHKYSISIAQVPGFPINLKTELFDLNVLDEAGQLLVATVTEYGSMVGDVDTSKSKYDPNTGKCDVTFTKPLKPEQGVQFIKRFTQPATNPNPPMKVTIPNLVPYESERNYTFSLKVFDVNLNKHFPVAPGTVTITAITQDKTTLKVKDDRNGKLIGNVDPSGKNYIKYDTGEVNITFSGYLRESSPIQAEHGSFVEVKEFQKDSDTPVKLRIVLDWEDLARIVKATEQTANSAEANLKYRANT